MVIIASSIMAMSASRRNASPYGGKCHYQKDTVCQERAGCSGCCVAESKNN